MTAAEFIAAVEAVEIRWPLRMLQPQVRALLVIDTGEVELQLTLKMPHRDTGEIDEDGITVRQRVAASFDESSSPSNAAKVAAIFVREMLMGCLEHEVQESLWADGRRIFDPHREGA